MYHRILPQLCDFACFILAECEKHCALVDESAILRVDIGVELIRCSVNEDEIACINRQACPSLWQSTGERFISRFFLNEVTSTLDINWFSVSTLIMSHVE